jgi:hypothetical protein
LHTVTFVQDFNLTSDIILPFAVPERTEFELLPPFNIGEPLTMETPNGTAAVIALNKLTFYPALADSNGNITYLNGTNIQYTMDGSEKALNSGIIQQPFPPAPENETATGGTMELPQEESMNATTTATSNTTEMLVTEEEGEEVTEPSCEQVVGGPPFPFIEEFTVTFGQPGTYDYFCALHPWMTGQVLAR